MSRSTALAGACTALAASLALGPPALGADLGPTQRVSVAVAGAEPDGESYAPVVSANGRYVAFESDATNLIAEDTNGVGDVFVRDLRTGATERVSVGTDGAEGDQMSWEPQISADGRTIAFMSRATTLGGGPLPPGGGIFLRDLDSGTTRLLRVRSHGSPVPVWQPVLSGNGRFVAFMTPANLVRQDRNDDGALDVYRVDVDSGKRRLVSVNRVGGSEPQLSERPSISRSGRFVAWTSSARLVRRDRNHNRDIYVRDLHEGHPRMASVSSRGDRADNGSMGASISATGRYVVFSSLASTLVPHDTNREWDVFVRDRSRGVTRRVSLTEDGQQANGQSQAYAAWAEHAGISRDGRYVVFTSRATDLVAGDANVSLDVFLHDRVAGTTRLVSETPRGHPGNDASAAGAVSADGGTLVFGSAADDLVTGDLDGVTDVFTRPTG